VLNVSEEPVKEGDVRLLDSNKPDCGDDDVLDLRGIGRKSLWGEFPFGADLAVVTPKLEPELCQSLEGHVRCDTGDRWIGAIAQPSFKLTAGRSFRALGDTDGSDAAVEVTDLRARQPAAVGLLLDDNGAVLSTGNAVLRHRYDAIHAAASTSFLRSHSSTADRR
jgi:hypothetical protein